MNIFKSRYFFCACMLSIALSVFSFFVLPVIKLIIAMLAIIATMTIMIIYITKKPDKGHVIIAIMFCLATFMSSFSSYIAFDAGYMSEKAIVGKEVEIQAVILGEEYNSSNMSGYSIRVEKVDGDDKNYRAILECAYISEVHPGDRIVATVTPTDFQNNLRGYAEKKDRLSDGYFLAFESADEDSYTIIEHDVGGIRVKSSDWNFKLSYKLRDAIGGEEGNLSAAMLLGSKEYLSDTTVRDYSRSGASHYLALSGLHMSIVMGVLALLFRLFRIPKIPRAIALIVLAVVYYILTGMSMSATRSLTMLLWIYISMILSYKSDTLTNLSFAGAVILIVSPFAVVDAAFWMSFAATFGIVVFMKAFEEIFDRVDSDSKLLRWLKKAGVSVIGLFTTTVCAFLGLVLVISIFTKEYALYSIPSSVALSLPSAGIILFSLLLPIFSFCPPLRSLLIAGIRKCAAFSLDVCSDISMKENAVFSLDYDFLVYFAIAFAIVLMVTLMIKIKRKYLILLSYLPIIAVFILTVNIVNSKDASRVDVTYLNTSNKSDIFVLANNGDVIICDFSNGSSSAFSYALEAVDNSRASEIEAIMLTDYHTAHIPTLSKIFKSRIVRQIWLPEPSDEDSYYKMLSILDSAKANNVKTRMYKLGDNLYAFGELKISLDQSYIERSSIPVSLMNIECNDDSLTYFSTAFGECERSQEFINILNSSDYLIAGSRGPEQHNYFSVGDGNNVKEILIPDKDLAVYLDSRNLSVNTPILIDAKNKTYTFYRNLEN